MGEVLRSYPASIETAPLSDFLGFFGKLDRARLLSFFFVIAKEP
jgi:hypothetical protein